MEIEKLIQYFSKIRQLTDEEIAAIEGDADVRKVKKGHLLLKEGQKSHSNFFILEGFVRQYFIEEGEEKTTNFFTEGSWILPSIGENSDKISSYYLECMDDCSLVFGNDNKGNDLIQRFPKFQEIAFTILEKEIKSQQEDFFKYIKSTPEQRYAELQELRPELLNRVPQYLLASYIGVKPESLSRIRNRMTKHPKG